MICKMTFRDIIHGNFELPPLIKAIINTKHFRRLLEIKQLGCAYKVYNEAVHTRYHHCIGTYFLATKFLECLERNTNDLVVPELYKDCIVIAGLLHDVGHGPFSHFWERVGDFDHEKNSQNCIDVIFDSIPKSLCSHLFGWGIELIKALIIGDKKMLKKTVTSNFEFIFEIIHNEQCEIDVDKWDYLKRDAFYTEKYLPADVKLDLNFDEVFTEAKVSKDGTHIQYKYEHFNKIYNLFKSRELLHVYIYQNPNTKVLENILLEAIRLAEKMNYNFYGKKFSRISSKDEEFLKLTDNTVFDVLNKIEDADVRQLMNYLKENALEEIHSNNNEEHIICPQYLRVHVKVEYAGEKMPMENIQFYGNPKEKPCIEATEGYYEKIHYFRATQSSPNIY